MLQKLRSFLFNLFVVLLLFLTFLFFVLNTTTNRWNLGNVFDFLKKATVKSQQFGASSFGHQIGEEYNVPQYGEAVMKAKPLDYKADGQNYVNIGPGIFLLPGKYILTYDIAVSNAETGEDFATIDVYRVSAGQQTEKILNSSNFNQGFQKEELEFETEGGRGYEFRVLYLGKGELKVGKATISSTDRNYFLLLKKMIKSII